MGLKVMRALLAGLLGCVVSLLVAGPAVAGGPTSVLISVPGTGRMAALHASSPEYGRLATYVGAYSTNGTPTSEGDAGESHAQGEFVTMTWLIHDVQVWRVDRVYLSAKGGPWIATQQAMDGDLGGTEQESWHTSNDGAGLKALLHELGLDTAGGMAGAAPGGPATGSGASVGESSEVAADPAAAPAAQAAADQPGTSGWVWAVVGLVAGAVLTVAGEQAWARRRRGAVPAPAAGTVPEPGPESVSESGPESGPGSVPERVPFELELGTVERAVPDVVTTPRRPPAGS
jgi:hypothetical protein